MCQANALKQHFKLKIQTKHFWELKMTYSTHCQHKQKLKPKWARHYWRWCSQHHRGNKKSVVNSVVKKAGTVQHRAQNRKESKDNGKPQSHWVHFNPVLITISAQEIKPLCLLLQEATSISPEQRQTFAEGTLCHCATETSPPTASALRSQQMFSLLPWKAPDALLTGWAFKNALNCFFLLEKDGASIPLPAPIHTFHMPFPPEQQTLWTNALFSLWTQLKLLRVFWPLSHEVSRSPLSLQSSGQKSLFHSAAQNQSDCFKNWLQKLTEKALHVAVQWCINIY